MGRKFPHRSPMNLPKAAKFGALVRLDPQDFGTSLGQLRYDQCLEDKGTGWSALIPMPRPSTEAQQTAVNQVMRADDTIKQIESDADHSITLLAKNMKAEPVPGLPYHARGNLLQSHLPAFLRPLATRFISCVFNYLHEVPRKVAGADGGEDMIEYKTPFDWRAHFDGTAEEWPMMLNSDMGCKLHARGASQGT